MKLYLNHDMVIDRQPVVGQSAELDQLYTFSSKPSSPGERFPDILVRFQAVSRTQPCIAYQYCKLNSKEKLSTVRQYINHFFKNYFDDGFIFLSKTKEILRSKERCLTLFDIFPKVPSIYNKRKEKEVPNDAFMYHDVQYKKIQYEYDGKKEPIMCACVVFLYEASKVSHWAPEVLHEDLSANTIEGFCFIPTDIMSWKDKIIDLSCRDLYGNSCFELLLKQTTKDLEFIIYKLQVDCVEDLLRFQLTWCSIINENKPLSKYLSKHLTKLDFDLNLGQSLLHIAVRMKDNDVIDSIISKGASLEFRDITGFLPFHIACRCGYKDIEKLYFNGMEDSDLCRGIQLAIKYRYFHICSSIHHLNRSLKVDEQTFAAILEVLDKELRDVSHDKGVEKDYKVWENMAKHLLLLVAKDKITLNSYFLIRKDAQAINLHAVDVYGHSILHYTVNLTESTIDMLLTHISSVQEVETRLKRGLKRWNDKSDYRAWLRKVTLTDFRKSHCSENPSTKSSKPGSAFKFQTKIHSWDPEQQSHDIEQRIGKKSAVKCIKCNKYVAHKKKKYVRLAGKHICIRNCILTKPGDDGRRRMKVKPFFFHSFDYSENVSPLIQAARAGQTYLIKRLNKYDHSYKGLRDSQNRSLLDFAVDQNSVVLLKTLFEITPVIQHGLLHRILMQKSRSRKDTNRKSLIEFLLSKGYSPEEIPEALEVTHDIGSCAWRADDRKPRCSRDCHLKAYTSLEVSVRNNEEEIFKLLLDFTANLQQNFLLNLLAYNGNVWMIESFLKKRTKLASLKEKEVDIEKSEYFEIGHVLDIACCSKKLSTVLIQSLVKVTPDIFINAYVTDPEEYSVQSRPDIEWNMLYEMTTLGKLMSKDHPLAKSKEGKERIENAACFLIDSGIQLDDLVNEDETTSPVHGVCEAFMCAMENGYYRAAVSLLEEGGDVVWDCAMNINKCKIQNKFNRYSYPRLSRLPDPTRIAENERRFRHKKKFLSPFHYSKSEAEQFQRFLNTKRDFLKYHILLACQENVPETVLRELLRAGREFFDSVGYSVPDINLDEIHDDRYNEVCTITDPICRILVCVCEIISAYSLFKKRYDVLRIFKLAPVMYSYVHLLERNIFFEPINRGRGSLILQRCADLAYRKCKNRKLKNILMCENTNLLHVVSSGDSVDIVKTILKAETPIDIDSIADNGLRPIDVAAACGSWNVYKLLCDNGALVSGQTLVACCATENFLVVDVLKI
ncbi:hypothetical protein KUTeg_015909 [Tegillarca granosa]|uniref:Uncharacterized protein n=1 Tax=Tegillarca granosa TaxID=220873 RepID=A0ABQ9EJB6_TEGGR|nr:hypothetical protein KUTeg_015909 [Tegillarca granosa]